MARIRTIKPEFWSDEKLSVQDPVTRLVFLGLISMADDAGRLVDNVKLLDGMLFPGTDDTCREALETLAKLGRIIRYESASHQQLIQISKWKEHQKVDKPSKYVLPGPRSGAAAQTVAAAKDTGTVAEPSGESREGVAKPSRSDLGPTTTDLLPPTNDQRAGKRPRPSKDQLPPAAREFGKHFYRDRGAPRQRQEQIHAQLLATLNGGAKLRKGMKVRAQSIEHLERRCREVIAEGVKDPDKAIVVLLTKLADVGNATDSPTEKAAAVERREEVRDEADAARRFALAVAWLEENREEQRAIDTAVGAQCETNPAASDKQLGELTRRMIYRAAVLKAWTDAGEPIVKPAGRS